MSDSVPPLGGWRTFVWLWGSQALSVLGSAVSGFAFNIYLTQTRFPDADQKPELAAALSLTALAWTLTAIFAAPLAGTWADRHDRRRTMLACDLLEALLTLATLGLILTAAPLWTLIATTALFGLVGTFHGSAFDASYAALVAPEQLPRANGMMQTVWSLSGLLGPALGAVLVGLPALLAPAGAARPWAGLSPGVPLAYLADTLSFGVALLVLLRLRFPPLRPDGAQTDAAEPGATGTARHFWHDMGFGWRFIGARRPLLHLLLTFAAVNLCTSGLSVLEPLIARFTLATPRGPSLEATLAALTMAQSVGGVVGGLAVTVWGGLRRQRVLGVLVPMVVCGLALTALGLSGTLVAASAALLVFGLTLPVMNAHSQSIWQAQVPTEMQGRVFSVRRLIAQFTAPLSTLLAGLFAARATPGQVALIAGLTLTGVVTLQLLNPVLRRIEALPGAPKGRPAPGTETS